MGLKLLIITGIFSHLTFFKSCCFPTCLLQLFLLDVCLLTFIGLICDILLKQLFRISARCQISRRTSQVSLKGKHFLWFIPRTCSWFIPGDSQGQNVPKQGQRTTIGSLCIMNLRQQCVCVRVTLTSYMIFMWVYTVIQVSQGYLEIIDGWNVYCHANYRHTCGKRH